MNKYKPYPSYKDSGVEWLNEVPKEWNSSTLKFQLNNLDFRRTPISASERGEIQGHYPYYGASGIIDYVEDYIFSEKTILIGEDGANLLSKSTPLAFIADGKYWVNNHAHILKPKDELYNFWSYTLNSLDLTPVISGSAQPKLTAEALGNLFVVFPASLSERQTIANYLDSATAKIDTLIEKQIKLIALLKEKCQAVISTAVTRGLDNTVSMKDSGVEWLGEIPEHWDVWKMTHAFNTIGSGTTPSSNNEAYYNGYIPWVTTGELRENTIVGTKKLLTDKAIMDNTSLKLFPIGSIVIAMYGATIGRLGVLGIKASTNQACCVMTNSASIKNEYLYYWLMGYRDEIIKLGYGGGQPNISQDTISTLKISAPSLELQEEIINYLDTTTSKIDTLITKTTKAIDLLKEKRTALISSAVTGKIDVREIA